MSKKFKIFTAVSLASLLGMSMWVSAYCLYAINQQPKQIASATTQANTKTSDSLKDMSQEDMSAGFYLMYDINKTMADVDSCLSEISASIDYPELTQAYATKLIELCDIGLALDKDKTVPDNLKSYHESFEKVLLAYKNCGFKLQENDIISAYTFLDEAETHLVDMAVFTATSSYK